MLDEITSELIKKWNESSLNIDLIYPIGAIYMSTNNVNPRVLFGGTWEQIKDRFLLSAGDSYKVGATGGEATHTLSTAEMPTHNHSYSGTTGDQSAGHTHGFSATTGTVSSDHGHSGTTKEDVVNVAKAYFSRWRIEEYFRCKKQMFQFENFRVRRLTAINALNFYITLCMAFLAHISMKSETNALKVSIIQKADPVKEKVHFCYYRLAKGISQSPTPVGLIKVPLFVKLLFSTLQKFGRLVLWEAVFILELHSAETQV